MLFCVTQCLSSSRLTSIPVHHSFYELSFETVLRLESFKSHRKCLVTLELVEWVIPLRSPVEFKFAIVKVISTALLCHQCFLLGCEKASEEVTQTDRIRNYLPDIELWGIVISQVLHQTMASVLAYTAKQDVSDLITCAYLSRPKLGNH